MARPSNNLRKFVELYVDGPMHMRGQWEMCANGAGMTSVPDPNDPMVRRLIETAGGKVPDPNSAVAVPVPADQLAAFEEALAADADGGRVDWKNIRRLLPSVMKAIATGEVRGTPSQVAMVKYIAEKAEAQSEGEDEVHNVVVLPTQGSGADLHIDEEWMQRLRNLETKDEA